MTNTMNSATALISVPIHITAHHVHLSESVHEFLKSKIAAVARLSKDVRAIDIVLRRTTDPGNKRFAGSVRIALPGRDIHSHAAAQDLYVAIGLVSEKLARRMRKRKTRLSKTYGARAEARRSRGTRYAAPMLASTELRYSSAGMQRALLHETTHL